MKKWISCIGVGIILLAFAMTGRYILYAAKTPKATQVLTKSEKEYQNLTKLFRQSEDKQNKNCNKMTFYGDYDGDGTKDRLTLIDAGCCGGDGGYKVKLECKKGKTYQNVKLPKIITNQDECMTINWTAKWDGKQCTIENKDLKQHFIISRKQMKSRYLNCSKEEKDFLPDLWKTIEKGSTGQADGISAFAVKKEKDGLRLLFRQYMTGPSGHHLDHLGYCITEMKLNKNHTWNNYQGYFLFNQ